MENKNKPAFPMQYKTPSLTTQDYRGVITEEGYITNTCEGLTKREYFAAMAMQGIIASGANYADRDDLMATDALKYANALLTALDKTK